MEETISCGAVVYCRKGTSIRYLLIQNLEGIYGFPKGHMEPGETELQTARREIFEETGFRVQFLEGFRTTDSHEIPRLNLLKHIVNFLAEVSGGSLRFQETEILNGTWASHDEAMGLFQFESSKRILAEAQAFLEKTP